jgi:hypothetical protein
LCLEGAAADKPARDVKAHGAARVKPIDDPFDLHHDLGANAVAGKE